MLDTILVGIFITVVGGLILYHIFGIGRPSKPKKLEAVGAGSGFKVAEAKIQAREQTPQSSPRAIIDDVNAQPPYRREEVEKSYIGLKVEWVVAYHTLHSEDGLMVRLMLKWDNSYPWVYTVVSLEDYPELKSLRRDTQLKIKGVISKVDGHDITLIKPDINFNL